MSSLLTGKPELNRLINRCLILDKIRRQGTVSRADLAKQTAIRPPSVSAVVKQLIEEGLVDEVGLGETRMGRAPRLVALNRTTPRVLGFELRESHLLAGLCDLSGDICVEKNLPFSPGSPEATVDQLHKIGAKLLADAGISWDTLQGVGIAMPGYLSGPEGRVRWCRAFDWRDVPFKQICQDRWGVATDVVNDSLAGGMAAQMFATEESARNLVFFFVRFDDVEQKEVGLGAGIIINGEPFHGEFGAAGEFRTPIIHPLTHFMKSEDSTEKHDTSALIRAFQQGDPAAQKALDQLGKELSSVVLQVVNLIEPGVLMIDSDEPVLRDWLLSSLQKTLDDNRLPYESGKTRLIASTLGEYGILRGAVVPSLQRIFRVPQWS